MSRLKEVPLYKCQPLLDAVNEHIRAYHNLGADYSVTDLITSPRYVQLKKRHWKDIDDLRQEEFREHPLKVIKKQLPSIRGTAIHDLLEKYTWRVISRSDDPDYKVERRLWDRLYGRRISGKFDAYYRGSVTDYKTTSVWKVFLDDIDDWIAQQNIYAHLLRICGLHVEYLRVLAWFQDWDSFKAMKDGKRGYPPNEIMYYELPLWTLEETEEYVKERIEAHKDNEERPDDMLDNCTDKEMWTKDAVYKVFKVKPNPSVRSMKNASTREEAENWIKQKTIRGTEYRIEYFPGKRTKCEDYCQCAPFCNQYQDYLKGVGIDEQSNR